MKATCSLMAESGFDSGSVSTSCKLSKAWANYTKVADSLLLQHNIPCQYLSSVCSKDAVSQCGLPWSCHGQYKVVDKCLWSTQYMSNILPLASGP